MKVVITGGHTTPALAVIESLPKDVEVIFVGRKHTFESDTSLSFEYEEITKRGITFKTLPSARLQRSISRHTLPSLFRLPNSVRLARGILKELRPDVVLSFGGYIGLPVVIAASTLSIPSIIHEQTTRAGFSNKLSSRFADRVCISWESSRVFFPKDKTVLTGNPLRKEILQISGKKSKSGLPQIYITGGSGGSHYLNVLVEKHLLDLLKIGTVVHQTGDAQPFSDFDRLSKLKEQLPEKFKKNYRVEKFLFSEEASAVIAASDLVIGRAGINTISELIFFEKPALCIPLSVTGQKGEQEENAVFFSSLGLGRVLLQEKGEGLFLSQIDEMIKSLSSFKLNDPSVKQRFTTAAEDIVSIIFDVENKKANKKT